MLGNISDSLTYHNYNNQDQPVYSTLTEIGIPNWLAVFFTFAVKTSISNLPTSLSINDKHYIVNFNQDELINDPTIVFHILGHIVRGDVILTLETNEEDRHLINLSTDIVIDHVLSRNHCKTFQIYNQLLTAQQVKDDKIWQKGWSTVYDLLRDYQSKLNKNEESNYQFSSDTVSNDGNFEISNSQQANSSNSPSNSYESDQLTDQNKNTDNENSNFENKKSQKSNNLSNNDYNSSQSNQNNRLSQNESSDSNESNEYENLLNYFSSNKATDCKSIGTINEIIKQKVEWSKLTDLKNCHFNTLLALNAAKMFHTNLQQQSSNLLSKYEEMLQSIILGKFGAIGPINNRTFSNIESIPEPGVIAAIRYAKLFALSSRKGSIKVSKRSWSGVIIVPGRRGWKKRNTGIINIYLDVSGSVSHLTETLIAAIKSASEEIKFNCYIFANTIAEWDITKPEIKADVGYGTEYIPVYKHIEATVPDVSIIITDWSPGDDPPQFPGPVIWLLYDCNPEIVNSVKRRPKFVKPSDICLVG